VLVAPLLERGEHHLQLASRRGQPVGEPRPRAGLLVGLAFQHAVGDERRQPVGEHVRGDAKPVAELREPGRAEERLPQDQERPPLAEHAESALDGATRIRNLRHDPMIQLSCFSVPRHARL
jgi:hypothetical protein